MLEAVFGAIADAVLGMVIDQAKLSERLHVLLKREPHRLAFQSALVAAYRSVAERHPMVSANLFDPVFLQSPAAAALLARLISRTERVTGGELAAAYADHLGVHDPARRQALIIESTPVAADMLATLTDQLKRQPLFQPVIDGQILDQVLEQATLTNAELERLRVELQQQISTLPASLIQPLMQLQQQVGDVAAFLQRMQAHPNATDQQAYRTWVQNQTTIAHNTGVVFSGTFNAPIFVQPPLTDPLPPIDPAAAQQLLAQLPTHDLANHGDLPLGSRMPLQRNALFTGRVDDLIALAQAMHAGRTSVVTAGMGGVGKTSLAAEFAYRYGQYFAGGVFWLSCVSEDVLRSEIAACGVALRLPGFAGLEFATQVQRVMQEWQTTTPRLLIFDNCEDPNLLARYRPSNRSCRVLITSRYTTWDASLGIHLHELGMLTRTESIALLLQVVPSMRPEDADRVADAMGDLPLGVYVSGQFLRSFPNYTVDAYLRQLAQHKLQHPALKGKGSNYKPTNRELNLQAAFDLSYEQLQPGHDQYALDLFASAGYFAAGSPVPSALLLASVPIAEDDLDAEIARQEGLNRLVNLGLLSRDGTEAVIIHRLLSEYAQAVAGSDVARTAVEAVTQQEAAAANISGIPARMNLILPHLRQRVEQLGHRADESAARLFNEYGYYLNMIGNYPAAEPLFQRALAIREAVLGAQHPATAISLNNLAALYDSQGNYPAAEPLYQRALAIREAVLGSEHPDTATSLNNLAFLYYAQGNYPAAEPLFQRALAICIATLGADHPTTLPPETYSSDPTLPVFSTTWYAAGTQPLVHSMVHRVADDLAVGRSWFHCGSSGRSHGTGKTDWNTYQPSALVAAKRVARCQIPRLRS